jgi:hypothetical protein
LDQKKYQTRKIIRIPLEQVTKKNIGELLRLPILNPDDIDEIYQTILNINGAEVITPEVPVWQTDQKGPNCSFEWIFAYLKHQLTPNEYNEFRYKLFVSFSKLPSVNGDDRERLFKKIEKRKSRLGIEDQAQVEVPDLFDPKFREHLFSLSHNQMKKF